MLVWKIYIVYIYNYIVETPVHQGKRLSCEDKLYK